MGRQDHCACHLLGPIGVGVSRPTASWDSTTTRGETDTTVERNGSGEVDSGETPTHSRPGSSDRFNHRSIDGLRR